MDAADVLPADFGRLDNFASGAFEKLLLIMYHLCDSQNFLQAVEFVHTASDREDLATEEGNNASSSSSSNAVVKKKSSDGATGVRSKMAPTLQQGNELGELTNNFFRNSYSVELQGKKIGADYQMTQALMAIAT